MSGPQEAQAAEKVAQISKEAVSEDAGKGSSSQGAPAPLNEEGPLQPEGAKNERTEARKAEKERKRQEAAAKQQAKKEAAAKAATSAPESSKASKKDKEKPLTNAKKEAAKEAEFVNLTPPGEKKDLSGEMAAGYNPVAVEAAWDAWWQKVGVYKPQLTADGNAKPEGTFVIPLPPPNVTGALHNGHALAVSIQDALIRWNRMQGKTVLYTPGFDHAGISTQSVVEKRLWKDQKLTRHDLGREKLVEKIFEWKNQYQERITKQMRRLGASCDWDRAAFTMDEVRYKAVMENFCVLYERGLIYRANRLVNWCCALRTTLSNLECDSRDLKGRELLTVPGYDPKERFEFGVITSFAYQIEDSDEKIVVATTRPETMVGDVAIAVHPEDPRYKHLHGKFALHPFIEGRRMPIVQDDILVDMELGTGAVKITPAHDANDFACGERHSLPFINIMNDDGTLNENAGPFAGMKRYHARNAVLQALKDNGLYVDAKDNPMALSFCNKSGDVIEPLMKPQWWVKVAPMADKAIKHTKNGDLLVRPMASENEWYGWLSAPQDWCISRQLWWGHRCPAYFVQLEGEEGAAQNDADESFWIVARTLEVAEAKAKEKFAGRNYTLKQDEDVLDTWFSSGLWPFSTQGWPEKTKEFELFYPAAVLETGWDIIFFWVARMAMLGLELTGKVPFKEVFCHAMIRDAQGRKMSKSLGNVIDPLDVMDGVALEKLHQQLLEGNLDEKEIVKAKAGQKKDFPNGIPQCGADALRFTLCSYNTSARDINLNVMRVEGYRKFCNKIWNATKFAMMKFPADFVPAKSAKPSGHETLVEQWILSRADQCAESLDKYLTQRNTQMATSAIYDFWLYQLCDVYIEAMKPLSSDEVSDATRRSAQDTLYTALEYGLKMLHPFMPFVTEELWQRLPRRPDDNTVSIALSAFPKPDQNLASEKAERDFGIVNECAEKIRSLAGVYNLRTGLQSTIYTSSPQMATLLKEQTPTLLALVKGSKAIDIVSQLNEVPEGCSSDTVGAEIVVNLLIKGLVNIDTELAKADKKIVTAKAGIERFNKMLQKAETPEDVKTSSAEQIKVLEAELAALQLSVQQFQKMRD